MNADTLQVNTLEQLEASLQQLALGYTEAARQALLPLEHEHTPATKRKTIPYSVQVLVFARDRYTCRYCGRATVCPPALRYLSIHFPKILPFHPHGKWELTHPLYWDILASCDHVLPVSRGGTGDIQNLVTTCYRCNTIKSTFLLEELGWQLRPIADSEWDGLTKTFIRAMEHTPLQDIYLKIWLRALTNHSIQSPIAT